jgi:tryptophanyl-tRNA synthetase
MIFELYKQHLIEDDSELQKIYDNCKKGKLTCGDDKKHCCDLMNQFMEDFFKKTEKAKKDIDKLNFIKFK